MRDDASCGGRHGRHRSRHSRRRSRKGRILHTRISEQLEEDLRHAAEELRVPVSNLVRNILEDTFDAVESAAENLGGVIEDVVDEAERAADRWRRRGGRGRWAEAARAAGERRDTRSGEEDEAPAQREAAPSRGDAEPDGLLGWQPLVLNHERRCRCGKELARGQSAFVGVTASGLADVYRCGDCVTSSA